MEGQVFSHYQILEKLGQGGMGLVYKARDLRLQRLVAVKVLPAAKASDPVTRQRFLREAQAASALNHPNIVAVYDICEQGDTDYIVMEYVDGRPLNHAIPATGMEMALALHLGGQIAAALGAAHAAGIVHRDLKPGNVLVTRSGHVKVLDFGLAKWESQQPGGPDMAPLTAAGMVFGTVSYMAPEQAGGGAIDSRADIFSFGVLLQEMLTGAAPFSGGHTLALLHAIQYDAPRPLRAVRADLPQSLEGLVLKCLEKKPERRFQTIADVASALRAIPTGAGERPTMEMAAIQQPPLTRPPAAGTERAAIAVLPFRTLSADRDDAYLATGIASEIVSALTGVPGLRVASHLASFRFQEAVPDLAQVASTLNVRYVMTGSLRRAGNRIRVIAELADAADGVMIWSRTYERGLEDLFAVQEDIAGAIVRATGGQIIRAGTAHASRAPAESLDAWGLVRKAYHFWTYAFRVEGVDESLDLLRRAISMDPQYAAAYAYLGFYLVQRIVLFISPDTARDRKEAVEAAERALELAPGDPEVLENIGVVYFDCGQTDTALQTLRRAVQIAPFNLTAWGYLGLVLGWTGGPAQLAEAQRILDQLIRDTPDHPFLPYWYYFKACGCASLEHWEEAAEAAHKCMELQPKYLIAGIAYANAVGQLGRLEEARQVMQRLVAANPFISKAAYMDALTGIVSSPERQALHVGGLKAAGVF